MKTLKDLGLKIEGGFPQIQYDKNGNEIHCKNSDGSEWWKEYDEKNKVIHFRTSGGYGWWLLKEGKLELIDGKYRLNGIRCVAIEQD